MPPSPQALGAMAAGGNAGLGAPTPADAAAGGEPTQPLPAQPQKKSPPRRSARARYGKKTVKRG